jgi:hypothetical protein
VYEPSKNKQFARGLPYVVISRVTDLEKVALLLPIRPDHFINKHFIAENIKINEFYNNLDKNLILMKKYRLYRLYKRIHLMCAYIVSCIHVVHRYLFTHT